MSAEQDKRVCLGKIATAHGIRGLVKVTMYGDDPRLFDKYGPLFTGPAGDNTISLTMKNSTGKHWLAEVAGVADRNAAEKLRGTELWLSRDNLPKLKGNTYYHADLIGLTLHDENDSVIGTVAAVQNFGAGDLLEVEGVSKPAFYLPFTKANLIKVDIKGGTIRMKIPQEFLS